MILINYYNNYVNSYGKNFKHMVTAHVFIRPSHWKMYEVRSFYKVNNNKTHSAYHLSSRLIAVYKLAKDIKQEKFVMMRSFNFCNVQDRYYHNWTAVLT